MPHDWVVFACGLSYIDFRAWFTKKISQNWTFFLYTTPKPEGHLKGWNNWILVSKLLVINWLTLTSQDQLVNHHKQQQQQQQPSSPQPLLRWSLLLCSSISHHVVSSLGILRTQYHYINLHPIRKCSMRCWQTALLEQISQIYHPHHSDKTFTFTITFTYTHQYPCVLNGWRRWWHHHHHHRQHHQHN